MPRYGRSWWAREDADAVHLAAANVSADTFVAADRRLLLAARSEGLSVADVAA